MFRAHINSQSGKEQTVNEHLKNVATLAKDYGSKISIPATCELAGILHDMGKYTRIFDDYIYDCYKNPNDKSRRGEINHSTAGAKFVFDRYFDSKDPYEKLAAQLVSIAICSHHGGLIDCLDTDGHDIFTKKMETDKEIFCDEAYINFINECFDYENLDKLFNESKTEIMKVLRKILVMEESVKVRKFTIGMLQKYIFSCVIDADRYDTYSFMQSKEIKKSENRNNLWTELEAKLEYELRKFPKYSKIDLLRSEISSACKEYAKNMPAIYKLCVPTGGSKTLSSLRYALEHAKEFNKDRIIYVLPFITILEQNANDIKNILQKEDIVLEHHSNLIIENHQEDYQLLTERWDSPIILTTMVQLLETLFSGGTQGARRIHSLANSIIIFDEIQAIPIKCVNMFNSAMNFLSHICNTTVVLCTATQPLLDKTEIPIRLIENPDIIKDVDEKFRLFKRVKVIDETIIGGYNTDMLSGFVHDKMDKVDSTLIILNTKDGIKKVYNELKKTNDVKPYEKKYRIYHLSTNMCPMHRKKTLASIRKCLENKQRVICVSTPLIEAGVNISFDCVVRAVAGLDSIAQAAGRCNRHGESDCRMVYIINYYEENVDKLIDIMEGQKQTNRILDEFRANPDEFDNDMLSPKIMNRYYRYYFHSRKEKMYYTINEKTGSTLFDLLSVNTSGIKSYNSRNKKPLKLVLVQAFKTAGEHFNVIDLNTTGIIVPYGEGEQLIADINGECRLPELNQFLKKAQQYSVNLYEFDKRKLLDLNAVIPLKNGTILALKKEFYKDDIGVITEKQPMDFCNF